ncbi:hypothetical protein ACFQJ5_00705 [Halomicroarcula sp. GCM10025324]|uniref:hypothetical protein n=1 Tax=Haloarcula TaxID=2237 RepID=UPI00360DD1C8
MLLDAGRRVVVTLALYGFVLLVLFGKAYALVPSYFDRSLAVPHAPLVQLPLSAAGVVGLALAPFGPGWVRPLGVGLWAAGVVVFLATLGWTLRDNPTGRETGTGGATAHREPVDKAANAVLPVALAYLALGTLGHLWTLAGDSPLATMQVSHLLAAGTAALFVFGVGLRLLPRFLVATPPRPLVAVVLPTGAVGPALLGFGLFDRGLLLVGGALETLAVGGFALAYVVLFVRSDRRRVGFYAVLAAVLAGVVGVALALVVAVTGRDPALVTAHYRTMLLGFLGLTVVGAAYQFYPPAVGQVPLASDRTALGSIALLTGGLGMQVVGLFGGWAALGTAGEAVALGGVVLYAWLLFGAFARQRG